MEGNQSKEPKVAVINETDLASLERPEYVVGVGASAGGLEALELLFMHMPIKTGMAFVVVQHLSPDYKSMMDQLLARKTMIPIRVVTDQMVIESNKIYLIPPNKEMIAANGYLYLTERENTETVNLPINTFFRSLAETYQEKSIAIVLSGTGSDGSKGAVSVHDSGGFVMAQSPTSCKFDAMPENAIRTSKVDLVIDPQGIPDALIKFSKRTANVEQQLSLGNFDAEVAEFSEILILLNNRFDLDFSQYKPSTITRRLERRVAFQSSPSLKDYINVILSNHEELEALYYDLLIGVTHFFRDPVAFASLRTRIPKLLEKFKDEPEIRIWVSACASGQEAYSIAMMMTEVMENDPNGQKNFKIFATDIHSQSIQYASTGIYNQDSIDSLDEKYLDRFFIKLPSGKYQVTPEIRKPIVFAQHNLLKDPPFTRTHLVSCRNLLIYFNVTAQQRVLSLLSFSLMNQGLLFLGSSEAIGNHSSDFGVIDTVHRLFRKNRASERPVDLPLTVRTRPIALTRDPIANPDTNPLSAKSRKALEVLLQQYVPASVLVDCKGNILHVFGDAGKFLSLNFGAASLNIRGLVGEEAKAVLTQMLHHIGKTYKSVKTKGVKGFNHFEKVDIEMRILSESPSDLEYIIISLHDSMLDEKPYEEQEVVIFDNSIEVSSSFKEARINELEEELAYAQESLQTTVEELETSNEELQASNEELMASNEELQSTNEELQSVNEELFTVNAEFQQKEIEREQLKSDEQSIIEEGNLGILFLDESLKIRKFTPLSARLFNLIESDFGRPFSSVSGRILKEIENDVLSVYRGGGFVEKEVSDENGSVFSLRINSYRNHSIVKEEVEEKIEGVNTHGIVITFNDITKMHAIQMALKTTQERFQNTLNAISEGYFEWVLENNEIYFSPNFYEQLGYDNERPNIKNLLGDYFKNFITIAEKAFKQKEKVEEPIPFVKSSGELQWMICKGDIFFDEKRNQKKLVGITIDFTQQKSNEEKLKKQTLDLERSNNLLEKFAYIVSHDMKAPIRHIQNYLVFLQNAIDKNEMETAKDEIISIKNSADGLTELIDDIITYARVTSEKHHPVEVNLYSIVTDVIKTFESIITEKNISIQCSDLPLFRGDKSLLYHLMQNLISNACKYNTHPSPLIEIFHKIENKHYLITIKDNGIGFPQKHADKIFEPFKRLVTKDSFEGSGIGLSICKTVVEQHNGSIRAISEVGKGTSFIITFPI